jgi:hypothetical protein
MYSFGERHLATSPIIVKSYIENKYFRALFSQKCLKIFLDTVFFLILPNVSCTMAGPLIANGGMCFDQLSASQWVQSSIIAAALELGETYCAKLYNLHVHCQLFTLFVPFFTNSWRPLSQILEHCRKYYKKAIKAFNQIRHISKGHSSILFIVFPYQWALWPLVYSRKEQKEGKKANAMGLHFSMRSILWPFFRKVPSYPTR